MRVIVAAVVLAWAVSANALTVNTNQLKKKEFGMAGIELLKMLAEKVQGVMGLDKTPMESFLEDRLDIDADTLDDFIAQTAEIESEGGKISGESSAKGTFQFLTKGEGNAFQTALNRTAASYEAMGRDVPGWVVKAQQHNDPLKLTYDQEKEVFLANLYQQKGTDELFKGISEGDPLAKYQLYAKYHHTAPDEKTVQRAMSIYNL